jgi:hypothetical protein
MTAMLSATAALLLSAAAAAPGVPLSRATGTLAGGELGDHSYRYEKGIPPAEAEAIVRHVQRDGPTGAVVVRVPGRRGAYLVSAAGRGDAGPGDLGGLCLILLEKRLDGFVELARTRGAADSYSLRPVVFTGGGRTLVLAEMATEYSWGVQVVEVAGKTLRQLGGIDAGVEGEMGEEDPTPFARVRVEGGRFVITFDTDLVLGTGDPNAPRAKRPVVFREEKDRFVRVQR